MNYNILSAESNKPFGCKAEVVPGCNTCRRYITEICYTMEPIESNWFRQCLLAIEQYNGHVVLERFLRIYRAFNLRRYAKDSET